MIESIGSWTVWTWIVFYLIGSIIAGPLLVKLGRWCEGKTREEYPGGGLLLIGLLLSWLTPFGIGLFLLVLALIFLVLTLVCLILKIAGCLDKPAKHIP